MDERATDICFCGAKCGDEINYNIIIINKYQVFYVILNGKIIIIISHIIWL